MAGRIVVGIDGSEHAAAALRWAVEEASLRQASIEAVHAWSFVVLPTPADARLAPYAWSEGTEALDATRDAAERVAQDQVRDVAGGRTDVTLTVVQGDAATVLVDASEDADLLVVGNRGRGSIVQALFGSTSARVSDKARCPVVVVHAPHDD